MDTRTTEDVEVYRRALREISHNRYVVINNGQISDTRVLVDGDTILSDAEELDDV